MRLPYSLVGPDSVVVQVGAPSDTLRSGRSRGMHLIPTHGPARDGGIIEPEPSSAATFTAAAEKAGLDHVIVKNMGAWNEAAALVLRIDPAHPATNFIEGATDYDEARLSEFDRIEVPTNTIDSILQEAGIDHVDLVSITTNGAETEILQGMKQTIENGLRYICLARTGDDFEPMLGDLGFEFFGHDDRGFTYRRVDRQRQACCEN